MIFYGVIKNKKLELSDKEALSGYVARQPDCRVILNLKRVRNIRSIPQNRLYWLWLKTISEELGYDSEELHASFKAMFLTDRSLKLPLVRSTTQLDTAQFTKYLDQIERKVGELGIALPNPEEAYNLDSVEI